MKTFHIYKVLLISLLLMTSTFAMAQCPFTASLTLTDAGGQCSTGSNGSVFFTVPGDTPNSIEEVYYLVYKRGESTPVNSTTNTNPEVSLPKGDYTAEVRVQCQSGSQTPWTEDFTITETTTSQSFTATYSSTDSRIASLNAVPSGMIAYKFSGSGPYTIDITKYPAAYVGPLHFENIQNTSTDTYYALEDLAAGNYTLRITNGCQITTETRSITNTNQDIPANSSSMAGVIARYLNAPNSQSQFKPTEDHNTLFFHVNGDEPRDYWYSELSADFYEYTWYHENKGQTIDTTPHGWHSLPAGYKVDIYANKIESEYTISEMINDSDLAPTVCVRLKKAPNVRLTNKVIMEKPYNQGYRITASEADCDNADIAVRIVTGQNSALTYPMTILVREYQSTNTLNGTGYEITRADMDAPSEYVTLKNIDISKGFSIDFICDGYRVDNIARLNSSNSGLGGLIVPYATRQSLAGMLCESSDAQVVINFGNMQNKLDLRGAKIKYVGDIPLADDRIKEFTIPGIDVLPNPLNNVYLTAKVGETPWVASFSPRTPMPGGVYKWEITIPCGGGHTTFITSVTLEEPKRVIGDDTNFNPKIVSSESCGYAEIEIGELEELRKTFTNADGTIDYINPTFVLTKKWGDYYNPQTSGVYYDGGFSSGFETKSAGAENFPRPRIRVRDTGTYYVIGIASAISSSTIYESAGEGVGYIVREIVITDGDLGASLDMSKTGAYYCAQDESTGSIFAIREGVNTGDNFLFKMWNESGTFYEEKLTSDSQFAIGNIDIGTHGKKFHLSVEPTDDCSTTPFSTTVTMSEINNSATFITQNIGSDCTGTVDIEISGTAYEYSAYEWTDIAGNVLSSTNVLAGQFATGTKLYLNVTFNATGPWGVTTPCGTWKKEYIVTGVPLTELYWKRNATDANWNNPANWNNQNGQSANIIPSVCSAVYIPSTVTTFYPDLGTPTVGQAQVAHIYLAHGAQLYNQHKLDYVNAFISYDYGYYSTLSTPEPTTLVQPNQSVNMKTANSPSLATVAYSSLPTLKRAQWYMLATPLKGMFSGDFQLAAEPYTIQRFYKSMSANPTVLVEDGFVSLPDNNVPLSGSNNSLALWVPPYGASVGAKDQSILQTLQGIFTYPYFYPYFLNDEVIGLRPDLAFDRPNYEMEISKFNMLTSSLSNSNTVPRSTDSGRFIYEEDGTNSIAVDETYKLDIPVGNINGNGEVMIGNPYMAPIDFDKFLLANAGVVKGSYKLIVGGETRTYDQANPTAANTLSKYIPAQQAFIITLVNTSLATTLKFPVSVIATQSTETRNLKVQ